MTDTPNKLITPQTKVGELLDAFPELENVLIQIAPPFKKLRNPVLRRTVARVTSLSQAARVGGVSVAEMINTLRQAVGQPDYQLSDEVALGPRSCPETPDWLRTDRIVKSMDVRPMINAGEQPMGRVLQELASLPKGDILEIVTPFEPAPLIDKAKERGFHTWISTESPEVVRTYFQRP